MATKKGPHRCCQGPYRGVTPTVPGTSRVGMGPVRRCVHFEPWLPGIQIQTSRFRAWARSFTVGGSSQNAPTMLNVLAGFDSHYLDIL